MKRPVQPENKYYLSNQSIYEENAEDNLEFFNHGAWTINSIETNRPIRSLSLGDWIEYIDPMLSFEYTRSAPANDWSTPASADIPIEQEERIFYRAAIGRVISITSSQVDVVTENGYRFILGNNAKFVNYKSNFHSQQNESVENVEKPVKTSTTITINKLVAISILLSFLLFLFFVILKSL